ncbi:GntR family transcriptional regulator, partial [Methylobacterium sp. E-046]|nr:GntR family transcriptional regulator [Methylobacterium sp. E-046]
ARRKDCRLAVGHLAAIVGVAETTVRNAIREAVKLGLVTVEERRVTGFRNDTNIVRIVSPEWNGWLRLARKGIPSRDPLTGREGHHDPALQGGGCKSANRTTTEVPVLGKTRPAEPKNGCRGAAGDLDRSGPVRILAGGRKGRAMR